MKNGEIYLLAKRVAKKLFDEEEIKELYPALPKEDIVVDERAFKLHSKKKLKRKNGDIVKYEWWISFSPRAYIEGFIHEVLLENTEEYESLFSLAVRKGEFEELDKKVLEMIEYKPFYIAQKLYGM